MIVRVRMRARIDVDASKPETAERIAYHIASLDLERQERLAEWIVEWVEADAIGPGGEER